MLIQIKSDQGGGKRRHHAAAVMNADDLRKGLAKVAGK